MASSAGTKVTTDPAGKHNPISESTGPVASDSLAAESQKKGGAFDGTSSDQPSKSTTTTTSQQQQPEAGTNSTFDHQSGTAAFAGGSMKPKGANLTEGGFEGDEPNASFNTDIGSDNDPGRAALNRLQRQTHESALDAGAPTRQGEVQQGTGGYDPLKETSA